ncbi:MAG: hypothetical protein GY812_16820 [Actinomycetia bacterium]|nr:hypothetical protein [Actinomycetes bacterium]
MNGRIGLSAKKVALALGMGVVLVAAGCANKPGSAPCDGDIDLQVGYPAAANEPGWWQADTRVGGTSSISEGYPNVLGYGCSALELTTDATNEAKAQAFTYEDVGVDLSTVNDVSYWAYRDPSSTGDPQVTASLNIELYGADVIDTAGNPNGYTTLVYEPYLQAGGGSAVLTAQWQEWDASAGVWWSTRATNDQPTRSVLLTWSEIQAAYPGAVLGGFGANLGSYNPDQTVAVDGLVVGSNTADF